MQFAPQHGDTPVPYVYPQAMVGTVDELRRSNELRALMDSKDNLKSLLERYAASAYALTDRSYDLW